jgi:RNA-binding protein YlmH
VTILGRALMHLKSGFVRVNGNVVHDPDREVTAEDRVTLQPEAVTEHT